MTPTLRVCAAETEFFSKLFRNRVFKKKLGFSSCVIPSFKSLF